MRALRRLILGEGFDRRTPANPIEDRLGVGIRDYANSLLAFRCRDESHVGG